MPYVQFRDPAETEVVSVFGCAQDGEAFPNSAEIDDDDPRYLAFVSPGATIGGAKTLQAATVKAACRNEIYAGVTSAALGASHTYPMDDDSQKNMLAAAAVSIMPDLPADWSRAFWCADANGDWSYTPHDAAAVRQLARDVVALTEAAQSRYAELLAEIEAAITVASVNSVGWR